MYPCYNQLPVLGLSHPEIKKMLESSKIDLEKPSKGHYSSPSEIIDIRKQFEKLSLLTPIQFEIKLASTNPPVPKNLNADLVKKRMSSSSEEEATVNDSSDY